MEKTRKIIHIDMDAFYASVEQRDDPSLRGKPVIVGGTPAQRGVVAACSYEARKFGIRSAMPSATALRLCPQAILKAPRFSAYEHVSRQINRIFRQYTALVEPLSLDEAYLDVTENNKKETSATRIAVEIKKRIFERTSLTASAGVSYNKFLAKTASGYKKPDGLTVITPEKAQEFIDRLDISSFYGVGPATEKKMRQLGINSGSDLRQKKRIFLQEHFGKSGDFFYFLSRGIDERPVEPGQERKSYGRENTFPSDIRDRGEIVRQLKLISDELSDWQLANRISARTVTLKVKYHDFVSITRSCTPGFPVSGKDAVYEQVLKLLKKTQAGIKPIRLLGISLSGLNENQNSPHKGQMKLNF